MVPGAAVADSDVEQVELRVVGHRIPHGAAAAKLPPLAVPGLGGALERGAFESILRVAGNSIETPQHLAVGSVVCGNVAAHTHLAAAIADDHFACDHARRAGDGVALGCIGGLHRPDLFATGTIERDQSSIECAHEHAIAPRSDTTIDDVAAGIDGLR